MTDFSDLQAAMNNEKGTRPALADVLSTEDGVTRFLTILAERVQQNTVDIRLIKQKLGL